MTSYEVIELSAADIPKIIDVQAELTIGSELLERGATIAPNGLLISGHSYDDFQAHRAAGGRLIGAVDASGNLLGYALFIPGCAFLPKYEGATVEWLDARRIGWHEALIRSCSYIYLDQIGVRWKYHKMGVAHALLQEMEASRAAQPVLVLVMKAPIDNLRSYDFFRRHSYEEIASMHFSVFGTMGSCSGVLMIRK